MPRPRNNLSADAVVRRAARVTARADRTIGRRVRARNSPPMTAPLPTLLRRWSSATNRRRLLEELARALAWLLAAGVIAIGIDRLPHLLQTWSLSVPSLLDELDARRGALAWALGAVAIAVLVRAALRFRRLHTKPFALAREL